MSGRQEDMAGRGGKGMQGMGGIQDMGAGVVWAEGRLAWAVWEAWVSNAWEAYGAWGT